MSPENQGRQFRFGVFEANEAVGELRKEDVRLKLHSQPFQVLVMLLERPSELVTREEMRQRLWNQDTFVDFDHGLNTAVNKLREALGDSASNPRHIETITGRGYRFIAPVTRVAPVSQAPQKPVAAAARPETETQPAEGGLAAAPRTLLAAPHDLPRAPHTLVRSLLLLTQAMYLAFYLAALANLQEIRIIFSEARLLSPVVLVTVLVTTAAVLIPVRLFVFTAVAFNFQQLPAKFRRLFPVLLPLDLLWGLSPFLLVHHVSVGLAFGMTAALVYMPFAQRSLVLMYAREG